MRLFQRSGVKDARAGHRSRSERCRHCRNRTEPRPGASARTKITPHAIAMVPAPRNQRRTKHAAPLTIDRTCHPTGCAQRQRTIALFAMNGEYDGSAAPGNWPGTFPAFCFPHSTLNPRCRRSPGRSQRASLELDFVAAPRVTSGYANVVGERRSFWSTRSVRTG